MLAYGLTAYILARFRPANLWPPSWPSFAFSFASCQGSSGLSRCRIPNIDFLSRRNSLHPHKGLSAHSYEGGPQYAPAENQHVSADTDQPT